jgi:phosphatidylglycerophosphatase C
MKLAIFDFDKTLVEKRCFMDFLLFSFGYSRVLKGLSLLYLSSLPRIFQMLPDYKAAIKQMTFYYFFHNFPADKFEKLSLEYQKKRLPKLFKKEILKKLEWHKKQNHKVIVDTGSIEGMISNWCDKKNIELIGTKVEIKDSLLTGMFSTPYCHKAQKVKRLENQYNLSDFEYIYVYGDSKADKELFEIANEKYVVS